MLLTVAEFRSRVEGDMAGLVSDLQDLTGRYGDSEADAWRASLPVVATAFQSKAFAPLHLYFGGQGRMALEYRLPAASSWADMVLLGQHNGQPAVGVIEIKHWDTRGDRPGPSEGLIDRDLGPELHPSDQVRGYTEYCRRFHSAVLDNKAAVHGCVLFTKSNRCESYREAPNADLTRDYPIFPIRDDAGLVDFERYVENRLTAPDAEFAEAFEQGIYRQDRSFVRNIGEQLNAPRSTPFELLDGQRRAFALVRASVASAIKAPDGHKKKVIVVVGPPGSGKSVIAGKLWADIVSDERTPEGDVVFVTTSSSQNSNWVRLFQDAGQHRAASGAVVKANEFIPVTTQQVGKLRKTFGEVLKDPREWRENLRLFRNVLGRKLRTPDNQSLVSIVDEAHALINPVHSDSRGQFGFAVHAGPQAYHIMRASRVTILLLDEEQRFRERESTTLEDIKQWARELGAGEIELISLAGSQFRCAGSVEYLDWAEELLRDSGSDLCRKLARRWYERDKRTAFTGAQDLERRRYGIGPGPQRLEFGIVDTPMELESVLRARIRECGTARLVASYAREWKSKDASRPHDLPPQAQDFHERYPDGERERYWSKVWNFVPSGDYSMFVHGTPGSPIGSDPLCEVGCPFAVRGFDFDYIGLLWLGDLKWRKDRWVIDVDHVWESGLANHKGRARREQDPHGPEHRALLAKVQQAYRILLTRAMRGVFIWFEDPETEERVRGALG